MTVIGPRGGEYANLDQLKMEKAWRTKPMRKRSDDMLAENTRCEFCNGKSQVINHIRQGYYEGYELFTRQDVHVLCNGCHKYWTETGQQRPRAFDDCDSCASPIYIGRKKCFNCGSKNIISKSSESAEAKAQKIAILESCPEVRIGDIWIEIWAWAGKEIEILGFQKEDMPWPMVKVAIRSPGETEHTSDSVGLPAFKFGECTKPGEGLSYREMGF